MATSHERIALTMGDHETFVRRMTAAGNAAPKFLRDMALMTATWEPHDWSDFR